MLLSKYITKQVLEMIDSEKMTDEIARKIEVVKLEEMSLKSDYDSQRTPHKKIKTRFGDLNLYISGKSKKIVIFVHGILSTHSTSLKIMDFYIGQGYAVITYDNYGWGESASFGTCTMGVNEADLLKDVMNYTKENIMHDELVIAGESMGGGTIYSYLGKYGNKEASKFIIDSGYINFRKNVKYISKKKIWLLAYITKPWLNKEFIKNNIPTYDFVTREQLESFDNLLHFHSQGDALVPYRHLKSYKKNIRNFYTFKSKKINHVLGYYECKDELYKVLSDFLTT